MHKTFDFIGTPPRLRLTLTDEAGYSLSDEQPLDEAEEEARRVIDMVRRRRQIFEKGIDTHICRSI